MNLTAFTTALALILLAEMGDKTQVIAVTLSSRHNHTVVFASVLSALLLVTALGVAAGTVILTFFPLLWIHIGAGALFIIFGVKTLLERDGDDEGKEKCDERLFAHAFALTFVGEMGDKTQLATIALTASFGAPVEIFAGAAIGFAVVTAVGVWLGRWLGRRLRREVLRNVMGFVFIGVGVLMALTAGV